jgi:hypothetical protein
MRKILSIICLAGFSLPASAQFSQASKDSAKMEIQQLTADWNRAIVNRDSLTLDKLLAPDYSLNGSVSRNTWMNNTLHHIATDTLEILNENNFSFYGQAASSAAVFFWKASLDGKPVINAEYICNDIWIKRNGHWQVIIRLSALSKKR